MKLFQWFDTLIVAEDEKDARKLLKEQKGLDGTRSSRSGEASNFATRATTMSATTTRRVK